MVTIDFSSSNIFFIIVGAIVICWAFFTLWTLSIEREQILIEREQTARFKKHVKLQSFMQKLETYISYHLSTSGRPHQYYSDKMAGVGQEDALSMIRIIGLELPPPLAAAEWAALKTAIDAVRYKGTEERKGVHPRVCKIVEALLPQQYRAVYEGKFVDIQEIVKRCDLNIVEYNHVARISGVLIPLEIETEGNVHLAVQQALGYGASSLQDRAELRGEAVLSDPHHMVCLGSDGVSLGMGYIRVREGNMEVYHSGESPIPLWPDDLM